VNVYEALVEYKMQNRSIWRETCSTNTLSTIQPNRPVLWKRLNAYNSQKHCCLSQLSFICDSVIDSITIYWCRVFLMAQSVAQIIRCHKVQLSMNDELDKVWEEMVIAKFQIPPNNQTSPLIELIVSWCCNMTCINTIILTASLH
jgi:hypothetical protein